MANSGRHRQRSIRTNPKKIWHQECQRVWLCILLVYSGFVRLQTEGSPLQPCLSHSECPPNNFCGVAEIDSYEGWMYKASFCRPCSQCGCHVHAADGKCPQDKCDGTPLRMVRKLEGTFWSATSLGKFQGDICISSLTVRGSVFRMVSFRVEKKVYDSADELPQYGFVDTTGPSLCDFPDAPGFKEGLITKLPVTQADMVAKFLFTYLDGLPSKTTRIVELFDRCPQGFFARFLPIDFVKSGYAVDLGLETPFYSYISGVDGFETAVSTTSGYRRKSNTQTESVDVPLNGPTTGYQGLTGAYSGFFAFGTTRRSIDDLGRKDSLMCNITFLFDMGYAGITSWDQYTWGCRMRVAPHSETQRHSKSAIEPTNGQMHIQSQVDLQQTTGHIVNVSRPSRDLLASQTCEPGSHEIYETTAKGQLELMNEGEPPPNKNDPQWACLLNPRYCCDSCAQGKYQPSSSKLLCLSCPSGFTTYKNGSSSLADCCVPIYGIGLYNNGIETSFSEFGIVNATRIFGTHYDCSTQRDTESKMDKSIDLASCTARGDFISTIPNFTSTVQKIISDGEFEVGNPSQVCEDVHFTIQPIIERSPVASLIEVDFECPNCFFDLGPEGSMNVSIYLVSDDTVLPPELITETTEQPSVSRPRDPVQQTWASRQWKSRRPAPMLNYDLDHNFLVAQFTGSDTPYTRHYKHMNCSHTSPCPSMPKLNVSPQEVIKKMLSDFNMEQETQQSRFACSYEDSAAGQVPPLPWFGTNPPRCEKEYERRREFANSSAFNDYTPNLPGAPMKTPHVIGMRVHARVTPGHAGFVIGYTFKKSNDLCRAGTFSISGAVPCLLCPPGKFASTDGQPSSCFNCPKGTYAHKEGSIQCSVCPMGKSTTGRGSNSSESCLYFCKVGKFSLTGLEPCEECPRNTTQSAVGATYCDPCFEAGVTLGRTGTGYTNVFPWECIDSTSLSFAIEQVKLYGRQITVRVIWDIPSSYLHVGDIIAIFKGDPYTSIRQLQWMFPSSADTTCTGWVVDDSSCRSMGNSVVPRSGTTFEFSTAGPGIYSAVYFSKQKGIRILADTYVCPTDEEFRGVASSNNFVCPSDTGAWEATTGLYVCDKGQYSRDGQAPCFTCPPGTVSDAFAATECIECPQGFYSNDVCSSDCTPQTRGLRLRQRCIQCPSGKSTRQTRSLITDCDDCANLLKETTRIQFCQLESELAINATSVITTPPPDVCGNGLLRSSEECDDGNLRSKDGCSKSCEIERGWKCYAEDLNTPSICAPACGDGKLDLPDEDCDDGNLEYGDGCDQFCGVQEKTHWCFGEANELSRCITKPICGSSKREWDKGEMCDDGNINNGDGCSDACTVEPGFKCVNSSIFPDTCCALLALCGNGILDPCEICDDGNVASNDGCSAECRYEDLFRCRDGCSGPLCQAEEHCDEVLIGERMQVIDKDNDKVMDLDILRWLGIDDDVYLEGPDLIARLVFRATESGSTITWRSRGLLLQLQQGPHGFSTVNMMAANRATFESNNRGNAGTNLAFRGILGRDEVPSQLSCTYCSGKRYFEWHTGTISEPAGMVVEDSSCQFVITGGELLSRDKRPRAVDVTLHQLSLDDEREFLSFEFERIGYPRYTKYIRHDDTYPLTLHLFPPITIGFNGKSNLFNRTVPWAPHSGDVRFKLSYRTSFMDTNGVACSKLCEYDPDCVSEKKCLINSTLMTTENNYVVSSRSSNSERISVEEDKVSTRQSSSRVDKIQLAFEGASGMLHQTPCAFAQNTRQIVTEVSKVHGEWRGSDGVWNGRCFIKPSCLELNIQPGEPCTQDQDYFGTANTCRIAIDIDNGIVREYRSDCPGRPGTIGFAHGIIVYVSPTIYSISSRGTGTTILRYRQLELTWTRSTLSDRPVGVIFKGYLTFGKDGDLDPRLNLMQILLSTVEDYKEVPAVDSSKSQLDERVGGCRFMDLTVGEISVSLDAPSDSFLKNLGDAGDLQNLRQYQTCNGTFQQLQVLAASSAECKQVVDAFIFHDVDTRPTIDAELCKNVCFGLAQKALAKCSETCSTVWKEEQFTGKYTKLLYKKVYVAATAYLWASVACQVNHKEERCMRTILDYPDLFSACKIYDNSAQVHLSHGLLSAPFTVPSASQPPFCPSNCADALLEYQAVDGCCAASMMEAAAAWADSLSIKGDKARGPFDMDIGETANPWTALGSGLKSKTYGISHTCEKIEAFSPSQSSSNTSQNHRNIYPQCLTQFASFCDSPSWRPQCCEFKCNNGGSKATGDCYCSCPLDRVGAACGGRSTHVRIEMMFADENAITFHHGKRMYTEQAILNIAQIRPKEIELDSIQTVGSVGRRQSTQALVVMRIISGSIREAIRTSSMFGNGLADGRLAAQISNVSKNRWIPKVQSGKYPPIVFDPYGREICDDIVTPCYTSGVKMGKVANQSILEEVKDTAVLIAVTASLGAIVAGLLLMLAVFIVCFKEFEDSHPLGRIILSLRALKHKILFSGVLPRRKAKKSSFRDDRIDQDYKSLVKRKGSSSVFFGAATSFRFGEASKPSEIKPSEYSTTGNKTGEAFSLSDDLFSSLAPSGNLKKDLADLYSTDSVAISSDLVFDDPLSASSSAVVPTRDETGRIHGKLIVQGKGRLIESPHVSRSGNRPRQVNLSSGVRPGKGSGSSSVPFSHFRLSTVPAAANPVKSEQQAPLQNGEGGFQSELAEDHLTTAPKDGEVSSVSSVESISAEENLRIATYHYTPEQIGLGMDEVEFKKGEILRRLKFVKKIREEQSVHAASQSQPALLLNPGSDYLMTDRMEDFLNAAGKNGGIGLNSGRGHNAIVNSARPSPRDNVRGTGASNSVRPVSTSIISISETPRSPRVPLYPLSFDKGDAQKNHEENHVLGLSLSVTLRHREQEGLGAVSIDAHTVASVSPSRPASTLSGLPSGLDNDDSVSVLGKVKSMARITPRADTASLQGAPRLREVAEDEP